MTLSGADTRDRLLDGVRVHDAGTSVATAQAVRVLASLGARVTSSNHACRRVLGSTAADAPPSEPVDALILDEASDSSTLPAAQCTVRIDAVAGDPQVTEHRLQTEWGLAWLTGEPDGPPLLTGGWPALLGSGTHAASAAVLALLDGHDRSSRSLVVDARVATAWMLDDALLRVARGLPDRPRERGAAHLVAAGRLVRARDGWVSLSLWGEDEWDALAQLATASAGSPAGVAMQRHDVIAGWIGSRSRREVFDTLQGMRLACGMGLTPLDVLEDHDLRRRGVVDDDGSVRPFVTALAGTARGPATRADGDGPLGGVRVVEMAALWAGPAATLLLADQGATVTKVEGPRRWDGFRAGDGTRFATFNRGKHIAILDPATREGGACIRELLQSADILVEAHAPRVLTNWGLDALALRAINPRLIVVHLPAVGAAAGDWPQPVGYGFDAEMLCGQAVIADGAPVQPCGVPLGDPVAAGYAAAAALAGLHRRAATGEVAHVELAQRDALLHQVAGRCRAARHGRRWEGDDLAGVRAPDARRPSAVLDDLRLRGALVDAVDVDGALRSFPRSPIRAPDQ